MVLTLLVIGGALAALLYYLALVRWRPFVRCPGVWWRRLFALGGLLGDPRCDGGRYKNSRGTTARKCTRCNGDGWVLRRGRKLVNGLRRQRVGAR